MEHASSQGSTQGAIWVKNFKLRKSISNFIAMRHVECPDCHKRFQSSLNEIEENELNDSITNHIMTVKVKSVREKFIAIFNPKKSLSTHPDYYLYVYQAYTGAPAVYPFSTSQSSSQKGQSINKEGLSVSCSSANPLPAVPGNKDRRV